ncbi:MAG TPA: hypothetical protein VMX17_04655 [Candidatus Glassbacteria bacterium]|nr:hypothetical protein [Candidatus Glassbacteria bacterium]
MSEGVKDIEGFCEYIEKYAKDNPGSQEVCKMFLNRMESFSKLSKGEEVLIESTNTYKHYITVSVSVGVPSKMNVGDILKELKRIEDIMNANSELKFEINFS